MKAVLLIAGLLIAQLAQAKELVWSCKDSVGNDIEVYSDSPIKKGKWAPEFVLNQPIEVVYKSTIDGDITYRTTVIYQAILGIVTKHAPMAYYVLAGDEMKAPLTLTLLGIDEFHNRQQCN